MNSLQKLALFIIPTLIIFLFPDASFAQTLSEQISGQYQKAGEVAELGTAVDPRIAVTGIIQVLLTVVGTIFLSLIVLAGYWLFTARGREDRVEKAQATIRAAIIGLIITLAAYTITYFVGTAVQRAVTPGAMEERDDRLKWSDLNNE